MVRIGEIMGEYKIDQAKFDEMMADALAKLKDRKADAAAIGEFVREWKGGKCPECGRDYRAHDHRNSMSSFRVFRPGCGCVARQEKAAEVQEAVWDWLSSAGVPEQFLGASFADWDWTVDQRLCAVVKRLSAHIEAGKLAKSGVVLYGTVGTGKTHLGVCALRELYRLTGGMSCQFLPMADLVSRIIGDKKGVYADGLARTKAVLLDDIDKLSVQSDWTKERVFSLIDGLINSGATLILTSNLTEMGQFSERFGDAVASRVFGYCTFFRFEGGDYRKLRRIREAKNAGKIGEGVEDVQ